FLFISFFLSESFVSAQQADIKQQASKLSNIERNLRQKQDEQVKLLRQERIVKRDLQFLNNELRKVERRLNDLSRDIKEAERNLAAASKNYKEASENRQTWNDAVLDEIWLFHKMSILRNYEKNPIEYKIREAGIKNKKGKFDTEQRRAALSASDMEKWQKARNNLQSLRDRESKLLNERKGLVEEKNKLLKTTSAQRRQAEKEIAELQESARALQRVMQKLTQESRKREDERRIAEEKRIQAQREKERQAQTAKGQPQIRPAQDSAGSLRPRSEISRDIRTAESKKRRSILWPVDGRIIQNFGKNLHSELNTFVISNGIKIDAGDRSSVRAVDDGTVVYLGAFRSYGNVVIIDHQGFFSIYGQLTSIFVKDNQMVKRGQSIAQLGAGANSVLYFEIRRDNVPDNPMLWLRR
ncbi:MAG: peptidoglycan DD-metalloendopeptidase family protein, partial [Elusimicrobiota bacterium]|nr:peptidoglycan DD-metalloendopeptidase family protein [Elusimicrobiota bacterium]